MPTMSYFSYMFFKESQMQHAVKPGDPTTEYLRPIPGVLAHWNPTNRIKTQFPLVTLISPERGHIAEILKIKKWQPGVGAAAKQRIYAGIDGCALVYWLGSHEYPRDTTRYNRMLATHTALPPSGYKKLQQFDIIPGANPRYWDSCVLAYSEHITMVLHQEPRKRMVPTVTRLPAYRTEPLRPHK